MKSIRRSGGGMGIVPNVLNGKSGFRGGIGAILVSTPTTYGGRQRYNADWMGSVLLAHMAIASSVGGWDSALFRAKLSCAILYDDLRAR